MKKSNKPRILISLLIVGSILMIVFSCGSLAKYVHQQINKYLVQPEKYIFECNKVEDETYVINNLTPSFTISNYVMDEITTFDIVYSIQVIDVTTQEIVFPLTQDDQSNYSNVTITCDEKKDQIVLLNGLEYGGNYQVIVTTTSPYKSEFSFYYLVTMENLETYYSVVEFTTLIQVDLYIGSELPTSDITIIYGEYLTPNNANELMSDWLQEENQGVVSLNSLTINSHYQFEFFKYGDKSYGVEKGYLVENQIIL